MVVSSASMSLVTAKELGQEDGTAWRWVRRLGEVVVPTASAERIPVEDILADPDLCVGCAVSQTFLLGKCGAESVPFVTCVNRIEKVFADKIDDGEITQDEYEMAMQLVDGTLCMPEFEQWRTCNMPNAGYMMGFNYAHDMIDDGEMSPLAVNLLSSSRKDWMPSVEAFFKGFDEYAKTTAVTVPART